MNIPTESEIKELETRLEEMRRLREAAKQPIIAALRSDDWIDALDRAEIGELVKKLQARLRGAKARPRGTRVPKELIESLVRLLKQDDLTLSQMKEKLGLSLSYICKVKRALKDAGELGN